MRSKCDALVRLEIKAGHGPKTKQREGRGRGLVSERRKGRTGEMNRKIRSGLLALVAAIFALAVVIAPTRAMALKVGEDVYNSADFRVRIENGLGSEGANSVDVTVLVDGKQVAQESVSEVGTTVAQLHTETPEGYDIEVRADGMTATAGINGKYNLGFGIASETHSLIVSYAREGQTSGDTVISDDTTNYGTFSWSKSNASTAAYPRTLTVEVNGDVVHSQVICTPEILNNNNATSSEYWFTPNQDLYRLDSVVFDPADMIDTARRDVTVSLTTRCECGNDLCMCPGGADCTCPKGCPCELCNPTLSDNQIDTGYGILEYVPDGPTTAQLTVRIFVNGQQKFATEELTVRDLMNESLNFSPKQGYYYYANNGYDFHPGGDGSIWNQSNGYLSVVGDDSVLDIYLWTFANHTTLDIERRQTVLDEVEGYYISYQTLDPETGEMTTYTYQATSFAAGQTQTIPTNTDITLTAKCRPGYEVTQWSSAETYQGGISLTSPGDEDPTDTEAYGNEATLRVSNSASTRLIVYIDSVQLAADPTSEEVVDFVGENGVLVDCVNQYARHDDMTYELSADSLKVERTDDDTVTVTVNPDSYLTSYETAMSGEDHWLDPEQQTLTFTLEHDGTGWKVADGATPVKLTVNCDAEPAPEPPTNDKIEELLANNAVKVIDRNDEVNHGDEESHTFGPIEGSYLIGEVDGNATDGYSCEVTFESIYYVDAYEDIVGSAHELVSGEQSVKSITFTWDDASDEWTVAQGANPVNFNVVCETPVPDLPETPGEISDLFEQGPVVIDCVNGEIDPQHEDGEYSLMAATYGWENFESDDGTYSADLRVHPTMYVNEYNKTNDGHQLTAESAASQTIHFVYDAEAKQWKIAEDQPEQFRFEVECATPVPEQPELPTEEELGEIFADGLVTVDCTTEGVEHNLETFVPIAEGGYAFGTIDGDVENGATVEMTVFPEAYVGAYEARYGNVPHALNEGQGSQTVTLSYKDGSWSVLSDNDFQPIAYTVHCAACPVDTTPDAPTIPEVNELFVNGAVKVTCVNDKTTHGSAVYDLMNGRATVGEVKGNETDGYTVDVTVTPYGYVYDFQTAKGVHHTLSPEDQGELTITLRYVDGAWALPSEDAQFSYTVICADETGDNTGDQGNGDNGDNTGDQGNGDNGDNGGNGGNASTGDNNANGDQGNNSQAGSGDNGGAGTDKADGSKLPNAGDATSAGAVAAIALAGVSAAGVALVAHRRQQ